ncbi:Neurofilament medium polypeptide, partial [Ophiophagus hannah]
MEGKKERREGGRKEREEMDGREEVGKEETKGKRWMDGREGGRKEGREEMDGRKENKFRGREEEMDIEAQKRKERRKEGRKEGKRSRSKSLPSMERPDSLNNPVPNSATGVILLTPGARKFVKRGKTPITKCLNQIVSGINALWGEGSRILVGTSSH